MYRFVVLVALFLAACSDCGHTVVKAEATPTPPKQAVPPEPDPALPGVTGFAPLMQRLEKALAARGPDYVPRTHHLHPDGSPKYTNRLIEQTSPYLLQHAHNPVNWYPWGAAAFSRAKRQNRPIFLSVGYSTCHWCHVMERESFEDDEIARYLNENFVCIKVDREERPDVDAVYMTAVHLLHGSGGWPMTVVLTPDLEPFFGATYIPPRDGVRGARKGLLSILRDLKSQYDRDPESIVSKAATITARIRAASQPRRPGNVPGPEALVSAARTYAQRYDPVHGGFGRAPKFPRPVSLQFLLRYHRRTSDPLALEMVTHTLEKMSQGGIYDHVGGGFHRYSTDARWLAPHFEKMLYDNGQLVGVYLEAYQITGNEAFAQTARETLDYVAREMIAPGGAGFFSATDADSPTPQGHDEEGWFFTWTPDELEQVLGKEQAERMAAYWDVSARGNFEGRNILWRPRPVKDVAKELKTRPTDLLRDARAARRLLYDHRLTRPPPLRDDKILTAWNGLMISAFARGALVLDHPPYADHARAAARFILDVMRVDGRLHRSSMGGKLGPRAVLDDYTFLIQGLLDLYEVTFERRWLDEAVALQGVLDANFGDEAGGGYFLTSHDAEKLLSREKPDYDGAIPGGNSMAALNLVRLAEFSGEETYRARAERLFAAFAANLRGQGLPLMLSALDYYLDTPVEVVIVTRDGETDTPLLDEVRKSFLPNRMLARVSESEVQAVFDRIPLLESKTAKGGKTTGYVCRNKVCKLPTSDPTVFARQIAEVQPLLAAPPPALERPSPANTPRAWFYDPAKNQHWDPNHAHWHPGPAPQGR